MPRLGKTKYGLLLLLRWLPPLYRFRPDVADMYLRNKATVRLLARAPGQGHLSARLRAIRAMALASSNETQDKAPGRGCGIV